MRAIIKTDTTTWLIYLIVFCIQATEIKLGYIKLSEIILIVLTPFLFAKKINKFILYLLLFFIFELIMTFIITKFTNYEQIPRTLIKKPYIISIGRFVELITCLSLALLVYNLLKKNKDKTNEIITRIVTINLNIIKIFSVIYVFVFFKFIPIDSSIIVYDNFRLRGFYVEGGPFGLMLSFIFLLTFFTPKTKKRLYNQIFLVLVIIFMAKSKAGLLCVFLLLVLFYLHYLKSKFKHLIIPIVIVSLLLFGVIMKKVSYMYVDEMDKIHLSVKERPEDTNLIMGRMSGFYIVPKIIKDNPIFGIGLGNYPIVRNNRQYRGFFPLPQIQYRDKDASGFGGIVDILLDMGIVGILLFGSIMFLVLKGLINTKSGVILLVFYLTFFLFGIQLYFLYPWVLFAIILAYKNNYINEINN